jgi:two-component system, chemotaxis family, chemotaxis protein CheY
MKKRILVVEDFGSIRNFVCEKLERQGYEAIGAASSEGAMSVLTEDNLEIDLVITDYNMPDGTGYELLKKIKGDKSLAHIPVIFLTTESSPDKIKLAKTAGLSAWVKKPYRTESFFDQIQRVVSGQVLV